MDDRERGTRRVTQDDVAKLAGVSRSVVSYVLSASSRSVAPETRERIPAAISELGYRPNKFAQNLMRAKRGAIAHKQFGVVLSDVFMLRRPYYADILAGIHRTDGADDELQRVLIDLHASGDPYEFRLVERPEKRDGGEHLKQRSGKAGRVLSGKY